MKIVLKAKSSKKPGTAPHAAPSDAPRPTGGRVRVRENVKHATREDYLEAATDCFSEWFAMSASVEIPQVRVSCGFTGRAANPKFLGSCWDAKSAKDAKANIFITPMIDDTYHVLLVLAHELVHAVCGHDEGHGPTFKRTANLVGFVGKMKEATAGKALTDFIQDHIIANEGTYPHAKLSLKDNPTKTQTTRMIKCICASSGYTIRTTKEWLVKYGAPLSPVDKKEMSIEWPGGVDPRTATTDGKGVAA